MAGDTTRTLQPGTTVDMRSLEIIEDPNHRELALRIADAVAKKKEYGPPEMRKSDTPPHLLRHPEPQQIKRTGRL